MFFQESNAIITAKEKDRIERILVVEKGEISDMENTQSLHIKWINIIIIMIGTIFIFLSVFHSNLWFDESYSVEIANHSYLEIWRIGGNDVHPILYYWILHTLKLIFGSNFIIYRVFSALCISLLGILGYTHIRKDFGEKTGLLFSFFTYFLPVSSLYAGEIRMYSLGLLLGTMVMIYAYRIYQGKANRTGWIFFVISSLCLAYTHYYGLMLTGIVHLLLLIHFIKNRQERKSDLTKLILEIMFQIICYIPWLICFLTQLSNVSKGFWITLTFPGTLYEILTLPFKGNLSQEMGLFLAGLFGGYTGFLLTETPKLNRKPATCGLWIYFIIIIVALLISLMMHAVILLYRYLLILLGTILFAMAFFIAKDQKTIRTICICFLLVTISIFNTVSLCKENYHENNSKCTIYLLNHIQEGDILIYSNAINGAVITTEVGKQKNNESYFYNKDHWGVHEAYKAFDPHMIIKEDLDDILKQYHGRVWVIEGENTEELAQEIIQRYPAKKLIEEHFAQAYKNYNYTVELIIID